MSTVESDRRDAVIGLVTLAAFLVVICVASFVLFQKVTDDEPTGPMDLDRLTSESRTWDKMPRANLIEMADAACAEYTTRDFASVLDELDDSFPTDDSLMLMEYSVTRCSIFEPGFKEWSS